MMIWGILCSMCVVLLAEEVDVRLTFESLTASSLSAASNFTSARSREKRFSSLSRGGCDCGPGTLKCSMLPGIDKGCECENNLYVFDGECAACGNFCSNAACDIPLGVCLCLKNHFRHEDQCIPCDCGEDIPCRFELGVKFCHCNNYVSLNSKCEDCVCSDYEFCLLKTVRYQCDCASSADPRCKSCDCFSEDENCSFTEKVKVCSCIPPYVHNEEGKCEECDCGSPDFECSFVNGQKVCSCGDGYIEYNGTCKECDCGVGHSCHWADGNKTCICHEDHLEYNGTCRKCDCNANQICEINQGEVACICKKHYKEVSFGVCEECFCGAEHDCVLMPGGRKICICMDNYHENNGTCEECDCGTAHSCEFRNGKKFCQCSENFADNNGKCEECSCGSNFPCIYWEGVKICICNESFVQHEGKCHEVCHSNSCVYGTCEGTGVQSSCRCDVGFSGPHCEKVIVGTGTVTIICVVSVIIIFFSGFVAIYLKRLQRTKGYNNDLTQQIDEPFINDATFQKEETVM